MYAGDTPKRDILTSADLFQVMAIKGSAGAFALD